MRRRGGRSWSATTSDGPPCWAEDGAGASMARVRRFGGVLANETRTAPEMRTRHPPRGPDPAGGDRRASPHDSPEALLSGERTGRRFREGRGESVGGKIQQAERIVHGISRLLSDAGRARFRSDPRIGGVGLVSAHRGEAPRPVGASPRPTKSATDSMLALVPARRNRPISRRPRPREMVTWQRVATRPHIALPRSPGSAAAGLLPYEPKIVAVGIDLGGGGVRPRAARR